VEATPPAAPDRRWDAGAHGRVGVHGCSVPLVSGISMARESGLAPARGPGLVSLNI
jgi:hypothetical protein